MMELEAPCEGRVVKDEIGPRMDVGQMSYRVVIVPPGVTLSENTVGLLSEFAAMGGPVLAIEPRPTLVDGRASDDPALPPSARTVTVETLPDVLDEVLPFDVRVPGRPSIWAHHRRIGEADCYFLTNTDRDAGGVAPVQIRGVGHLEAWDPATGEIRAIPGKQREGLTEVVLEFPPVGSHLLMLHPDRTPTALEPTAEHLIAETVLDGCWELSLGGPNALTLDTVQVRIGGEDEDWSKPMHILDAHGAIAGAGVGTPFSLRFRFDVAVRPPDPVHLVVESPERFRITVNEQVVPSIDAGWWIDISFRRIDISAALQAGRNEIVLDGVFARDTELESMYLVGRFGVTGRRLKRESQHNGQIFDRYAPEFRVVDLHECICNARDEDGLAIDLTAQGLSFFAGRAVLRRSIEIPSANGRFVLEIEGLRAAVAHVRVNEERVGTVAWPPHQVDISAGVRAGENVIYIELVATLRNLLGPHHLIGGDLDWTGPGEFRDKSRWTDDYILVPFGLAGATLRAFEPGQ